ncbi:cytochrome b/b6 domain-containing protein [Polynucleobacter sp. HIN6]|uniref:cytochrome b/b6 domain-containing protein n=1 Tax=unclassified Polynucleobacter TaxID=2640945 RepID=UPI002573FB20|nr:MULTISPECIES: cytochrome b/b6 domain-containing protein [unclassified Polynucleobacter]BEI34869.1 cytochrome b/b6 domain-containing protein [Polynucleobacter sp. HIN6]BEI40458.1 cytochrome b/b6 domain-containing protein [Polynucleobacter sp. HIN9]
MSTPVRIWDLPTRLFHWALAICIVLGIVFVKIGGNAIQWHAYCGYTALALILFRIIWGFVGSQYARFANFIPSPATLIAFLRGQVDGGLGHNPLGALSVIGLLLVVLIQALTGLFADDDIFFQGPLAKYVSNSTVALLTSIHRFNQYSIFALVGLHIAAISYYYFVKRENLVRPMVTGDKLTTTAPKLQETVDSSRQRMLALAIFLLIILGLYLLIA